MMLPLMLSQSRPMSRVGAVYFADGNSQTQGANGAPTSYPGQLATLVGASVANYGVASQTITAMLGDAATQVDANFAAGVPNILIVGEVRNEISLDGLSANPRTTVNKLWQYCDGRRTAAAAAGKTLRIVVWNILPTVYTTAAQGLATLNAQFDQANAMIAAEWRLHADAFVDVRSDPVLGRASTDDTWWKDGVHLKAAGDTVLAGMIYGAIQNLR